MRLDGEQMKVQVISSEEKSHKYCFSIRASEEVSQSKLRFAKSAIKRQSYIQDLSFPNPDYFT